MLSNVCREMPGELERIMCWFRDYKARTHPCTILNRPRYPLFIFQTANVKHA